MLARVRQALRTAAAERAVRLETLVVEGQAAHAVPPLLEQAGLCAQAAEVHAQRRFCDGWQAREGQFSSAWWRTAGERVELGHERCERAAFVF